MERQPKEAAGSTPPSRSKIYTKRIFVTDHLYMSGALVVLVGEPFVFLSIAAEYMISQLN